MPHAHEDQSELTTSTMRGLGVSKVRMRILHIAARDGYCTAAGLMKELGVARSTITTPLKDLVVAGLLVAELDPERDLSTGSGSNRLRWCIDREAVDRALNELRRVIDGR